ncbi:MAG: hypothetical protein ACAH80_04245 [Alphaproteobacteria bacterium]
MRSSEVEWDDIGEIAAIGYIAGGIALTALFYEKMDEVSRKKPDNPRTAWRTRPGIAVAKQLAKIWDFIDNNESIGLGCAIGCGIVGIAVGITAMCFAGPWLGATWGGLLTLKGAALGLGTLGIGAAVAPFAVAATSFTALLAIPSGVLIARNWKEIKAEYIAGCAETKEWKQESKSTVAKPHPLVIAAEATKEEMTEQGQHEREQLFRRLQAKFPDEFAEAVRRTDTDTVLRDKVQVMKPVKIKFQQKKKTLMDRLGGAA